MAVSVAKTGAIEGNSIFLERSTFLVDGCICSGKCYAESLGNA